jgi:hypothetical protein
LGGDILTGCAIVLGGDGGSIVLRGESHSALTTSITGSLRRYTYVDASIRSAIGVGHDAFPISAVIRWTKRDTYKGICCAEAREEKWAGRLQ